MTDWRGQFSVIILINLNTWGHNSDVILPGPECSDNQAMKEKHGHVW